ncbi:DUF4124 domain-containing protein [Thiotrichales bacterium 19X7-9]|nr:DUF4124 domain-containing protein [Thiotrichales bacterium 19X7-9]
MKKHYFFVLLLFILPSIAYVDNTIYTWVDNNGQRHYSNTPHADARIVNLPKPTTIQDNNFPSKLDQINQNTPLSKTQNIRLISPKNNQSFHFMRHHILILANGIEAFLKSNPNSKIQVLLNNKLILTTSDYPIELITPTPGTYKLTIKLLNNNTLVGRSNSVKFIILPYPRKEQAGTTKATKEGYQNEIDGTNYQDFYLEHQNSQIQPQKPFKPTWQDYQNQVNPSSN